MEPVLRILDANLNRAREGLRTAEEFARFVANDAHAQAGMKAIRHRIEAYLETMTGEERAALLLARDAATDVGAPAEADLPEPREPRSAAIAGLKRAQEALRVLEEYASGNLARKIASDARYECYGVEQKLFGVTSARLVLAESRVMVLFDRAACAAPWHETLEGLLEAGARCFQLREKGAADRNFYAFAEEFINRASPRGAAVIINDRPDIAAATGADGVHLGQDDLFPKVARRLLGGSALVGVSCHNAAEAVSAEAAGADYIGLGAVFATGTKNVPRAAGSELFEAVHPEYTLPVFAIGGIRAENAAQAASWGARRVAVCSGVLAAPDPAGAWKLIDDVLRSVKSPVREARS